MPRRKSGRAARQVPTVHRPRHKKSFDDERNKSFDDERNKLIMPKIPEATFPEAVHDDTRKTGVHFDWTT